MVAPERIDQGSDALAELASHFQMSGVWRWLYDQWDYLELRWTDWVTNYRRANQTAVLQWLSDVTKSLSGDRLWMLLVIPAALAAFFLIRLLRRMPARQGALDRDAVWYRRFRQVLAGGGVASSPAETAGSIAARASTRFPELAGGVSVLASKYAQARYARVDGQVRRPSHAALLQLWLKLAMARLRRGLRMRRPADQAAGGGS
jgi:hypothetical protein